MNPNNFQNMGPARSQPLGQQPVGMQKNGDPTSSEIRSHIFKALSSYPTPNGWQNTVGLHQRVAQIHQMVTGLLILKPEMPQLGAVNVAVGFEIQEFTKSSDQNTYNARLQDKMDEIHKTRVIHAGQQQQHLNNQQAAQMGLNQQQIQGQRAAPNQNQFQQPFSMPQMQQTGQNMPNLMQQQQFAQQQRQGNPNGMQQQIQNGQPVQGLARPMPPNRGQPQFTQQEHQYIISMARSMASNLSDQEKQNLQAQARNFTPGQLHNMQMQGLNPLEIIIRNHATKKYVEERNKRQQQGLQGLIKPRESPVDNQGRPTSQLAMRAQGQQIPSASAPQQMDPNFPPGNMDQFLGQQAEALRHQAAGQDVVPASHGQGPPPQVRGTPLPQQQGQNVGNRTLQAQNGFQPQGQPPQHNLQHPGHIQAQAPTPSFMNMPTQAAQQHALQGQMGGLSNTQAHRTPQQVHNMPNLNQPVDLSGQKQKDQAQNTTQFTPKPNQRNAPMGPSGPQSATTNAQPNPGQQKQQLNVGQAQLNNFPPPIRAKLLSLPEEQRKHWLAQMIQRQRQQAAGNANAALKSDTVAQSKPQTGPMGTNGNQVANAQTLNTAIPGVTQPPVMGQGNVQIQGAQQPPRLGEPRPAQPKMMPIRLTPQQGQYMDNLAFPSYIINRRSELGNIPEDVQTWGQLKEYVHRNGQDLPPSSFSKILGLQSIHFQMQQQPNVVHQQRAQMAQQAQQAQQGNTQLPQAGLAPVGQMLPQGIQGPHQAPFQIPGQFGMPNMPEPTAQDLQHVRSTLPPHMRQIRDDQLRQMIQSKRQQDFLKTPRGQQALAMYQQRNGLIRTQRPDAQGNRPPTAPTAPGQAPQNPRSQQHPNQQQNQQQNPTRPNPQPTKPAVGSGVGVRPDSLQANQKGTKRNSHDDVIEVPNPKLVQQLNRPPNSKAPQLPQTANTLSKLTPEQYHSLTSGQKAQLQHRIDVIKAANQQQRATTQQNGPNAPLRRTGDAISQNHPNGVRDPRLLQLMDEVAQSTPPHPIVPMSPKTRSDMVETLKENTGDMVRRFEESVSLFLHSYKDEDRVKDLFRIRLHLLRQVLDNSFTRPVDNFTMSLKELEGHKMKLHKYFQFMMENQGKTGQGKPSQQPLNAANLQQQQDAINLQRAASVQKSHVNSNRVPVAPTTTHPPFPFGSPSPSGVPQYVAANKNELTPDKLVLPISKKRKNNNNQASPASTPAQGQGTTVTKSSPLPKPLSPQIQRPPAVLAFNKCTIEGCNSSEVGFATKEELERHKLEAHDPTHNIKDPMDAAMFAIESMRLVLGLDENGKCKPVVQEKKEKALPQAPAMKTSVSSQGIKQETATPMSRNLTQTGPSPSTNLLKTPQATTNVKTPVSETKSLVKGVASDAIITPAVAKAPVVVGELDGWACSKVEKGWFKQVFGGCASLNCSVGTKATEAYLERNPFTPPETPSTATSKASPHRSDISLNDSLNVNIDVDAGGLGGEWVLTQNYFDNAPLDAMADLSIPDLGDINEWKKAFDSDPEDKEDEKLEENEWDAPVKFLKEYDPEKYQELKRKQKEKESLRRR